MKVGPPKVGSPIPKVRGVGSHMAFLWDKNLLRLAVLITVLAVLVAAERGAWRHGGRDRRDRPRCRSWPSR